MLLYSTSIIRNTANIEYQQLIFKINMLQHCCCLWVDRGSSSCQEDYGPKAAQGAEHHTMKLNVPVVWQRQSQDCGIYKLSQLGQNSCLSQITVHKSLSWHYLYIFVQNYPVMKTCRFSRIPRTTVPFNYVIIPRQRYESNLFSNKYYSKYIVSHTSSFQFATS